MVNWITISSSSGNSGSTVVTVTASSYTELTARTASLTVRTVNSNLSRNVNITQEPKEIVTVTVSPTSISAPVSGGTYTFNIASNGAWSITYPSWLQVSQTSGTGNATITVTIPENESYSALTGNIVVSTADNTATVSVSQEAATEPSRISVSPSSILNIPSGASYYVLTVTSNTGWRLTDGPSWVRFSATSGSGDTTINITVVPNSSVQRADNIVFTTTDSAATATVYLSQAGQVTPTGSTEYLTFEILSDGYINWKAFNQYVGLTIQYNKNNTGWNNITSSYGDSDSGGTQINVTSGDTIYFRGDNPTYSSDLSYPNTFQGTTCQFNVKGNIMSLVHSTNFSENITMESANTFNGLFRDCTGLTSANNLELPSNLLTDYCYHYMFRGCTSLTTAPALPATILAKHCYSEMFVGCTSLTTAPALPATTLAQSCYYDMFGGCTGLTTAPALPATTLAFACYSNMFYGCTSLTTAPALPATTLADRCYGSMFFQCTSLVNAPALPATTLTIYCYYAMFAGCTNLITLPILSANILKEGCYESMFKSCGSLTTAPELPATNLTKRCYRYMFQYCRNLNYIKCLATDISASDCTRNWVQEVSSTGTFVKNPSMTSWTTGVSGIPNGWTVQDAS